MPRKSRKAKKEVSVPEAEIPTPEPEVEAPSAGKPKIRGIKGKLAAWLLTLSEDERGEAKEEGAITFLEEKGIEYGTRNIALRLKKAQEFIKKNGTDIDVPAI